MTSIGIVVPSWHYWVDPLKLQPLWELYYATHLRRNLSDVAVDVIDLREPECRAENFKIPQRNIYVYWVMKSADAFEVYGIIQQLRNLYPDSVHVAGGTHVDHMQAECAEVFDCIMTGTAEDILIRAIKDVDAGKLRQRYMSDNRPHFSDFGHAERDFIEPHRVVNEKHFQKYGGVPGTGVYFSRGCSFRCNFCVYNNPPKFEYRRPAQITAEIEYLKREYGVQGVNLRDEVCIPVNAKEAVAYIEAIGNAGVIWRGQSVPLGIEEMVRLAAESGLKEVALGLESVDSDDVITLANKPSKSIENNKRYIELLKKHGIKVKVCLIFGLPGESVHVLDRTVQFLEEVRPDFVAVSGFDPVPGSPFFRDQKKYGIKHIDDDLSKHAHLLYRFGDDEDVGLPFEYEKNAPWGKSLSREEIADNIRAIQTYLRNHDMSY
ncbi:MAG: radical SAM protein [Rhodospirillales bacterium]|jgi:radical SAM superfamily enzyme YgiQ (UPF0313 family)|nr:radical SAM protein [Rhodospirillales bacterium]